MHIILNKKFRKTKEKSEYPYGENKEQTLY